MFNFVLAKHLQKTSGKTRQWLADQCGIEKDTLTKVLNGFGNPSKSVVKLMAQALQCQETELLLGHGSAQKSSPRAAAKKAAG